MSTASSDPNAQSAASAPGPHAEPGDHEEVYFEGSPPLRSLAGKLFLYALASVALFVLAGFIVYKHAAPWWLPLGMIVIGFLIPGIPWLSTKRVRYRITNYRIDVERGLLAKNIDTLELWHVEDLHFHQSLMDRVFNVGAINVISRDESMPSVFLHGIPNPRPIYEMLKQRVIAVKRQRGVIKMDPG
jgi:hypothetical protein